MEKTKNAIQEIKALLVKFGFLKEAEESVENTETTETYDTFISAKLVDGTELMVSGDSIVEGAVVTVINEDSEVPAPDGVYELEDGTKITVKDGLIESIEKPVETPEEPTPEAEVVVEEMPGPEIMTELVDLMKTCIEKLAEINTKMDAKFGEVDTQINKLNTDVEEFGKAPAGKPIKYEKTEVEPTEFSTIDARVKAIVDLKNKYKK